MTRWPRGAIRRAAAALAVVVARRRAEDGMLPGAAVRMIGLGGRAAARRFGQYPGTKAA
ncbi:MAG: hypothetical protein HYR51_18335 [Candidatus Rokubacteria bacterium]|nr:hypothetical protein [Candidatus Rokubacteria bacterium]